MKNANKSAKILMLITALAVLIVTMASSQELNGSDPSVPPEVSDHANDWPLANKDYSNTRATTDSTISSENVNELGLAWSFPIPGIGAYGAAASNPLILGDTIYLQDLKCNVFALRLDTGDLRWSKMYNITAVVGPNGPAVGWGKVFVAKDLYNMTALDVNTGEELWSTRISNISTTGIDIQPAVYGDLVYVSTVPGTGDVFYAPGGIGVIYALDQETGEEVWNFSTVDSPDLWGHSEVNSGGGCWYPPSIDLETGIMFWGIANPAPFPGTEEWPSGTSRPGPNLYTNSMMALDHETGDIVWFNQVLPHDLFDHDFQISPILAELEVGGEPQKIVIGAGKMAKVYAFNRSSGEILWTTVVGEYDQEAQLDVLPEGTSRIVPGVLGGVETPMAYHEGVLYVPVVNMFSDWTPTELDTSTIDFNNATGELVAIDASNGKILWIKHFETMNIGGATVVNDLVFTAEYDGTIYAFRADTGEQVFEHKAPAGINGWPAVAGDTIVWPAGVGADPSLVALRLDAEAVTPAPEIPAENVTAAEVAEAAEVTEATEAIAPEMAVPVLAPTAEWTPDGVISEGEYSQNLTLSGGRYVVHWKNDAENLYMAMDGEAVGFVSIGFEPTQGMKDADMVMGWVSDGNATVLDLYSTGIYGPHPPDSDLGGTDDLLEFGGSEADGRTVIEFKRGMETGDGWDKAFTPGQKIDFIWAMSGFDQLAPRHNVARGESELTFE